MTDPAPYTPSTVADIRAHAAQRIAREIAHDLGWDIARLRRVASVHQIELLGDDKPPVVVCADVSRDYRPPKVEVVPTTGDAKLDRVIETLPPSLVETACLLSLGHVSSQAAALRLGLSKSAMRARVRKLGWRLRGSDYSVESSKGPGGGSRLIRAEDHA